MSARKGALARLVAVIALALTAAAPALAQPADAPGDVAPRLIGRPIDRIQFLSLIHI